MKKFKTVIVENNPDNLRNLSVALEFNFKNIVIADVAENITDGIISVKKTIPDLLFLSCNFPEGRSGFDLLSSLAPTPARVIMIGQTMEDAYDAMKARVADFLLWPIDMQELIASVNWVTKEQKPSRWHAYEYMLHMLNETNRITLFDSNGFHVIETGEILKLEAHSNYTDIFLTGDRKLTYCRMLKEFEDLLRQHSNFMRTHRSYIVNLDHVKSYTRHGVIKLTEGHVAHCGNSFRESFLHHFTQAGQPEESIQRSN